MNKCLKIGLVLLLIIFGISCANEGQSTGNIIPVYIGLMFEAIGVMIGLYYVYKEHSELIKEFEKKEKEFKEAFSEIKKMREKNE